MAIPFLSEHEFGISTIDTRMPRPGFVACHLIEEHGRAALVDVGVAPAAPLVLEALRLRGVAPEDVDFVMVTHVHLDHAGAAGVLMRALPNARLVVHPRGARHMIDPTKLIAGATAVYGAEQMAAQFGEVLPVPAERVIEVADGDRLHLSGRALLFLDTPGHARHHYCVYDERSRSFFTGDTFGLSYRELDTGQGPFIFPTTTPVQFDPEALHASIDRLLQFQPERMFLTHFGMLSRPMLLADSLHEHIDRFVAMARAVEDAGDERHALLADAMTGWLLESLRIHGCTLNREDVLQLMAADIELNVQGLGVWLDRERSG